MGERDTLERCVDTVYEWSDINRVVEICHRIAFSYLRIKASSHKSYLIRNEKLEDLAWDFIADLFQRDCDGNLVTIQSYFESMDLNSMTGADVDTEL